jgi:hypothetical protein
MNLPSRVLYRLTRGFIARPGGAPGMPSMSNRSATEIDGAIAHIACASRDESTMDGSPVRSR